MQRHTYSLLMALIRLAKGMLAGCEAWVRAEFNSPTDKDRKPVEESTTEET